MDADTLEHQDLERVFVAARLREAQAAETTLTEAGIEYVVEVEPFVGGIFSTFRPRNGAVFYVRAGQASFCRSALLGAGLGRGVVEEEEAG